MDFQSEKLLTKGVEVGIHNYIFYLSYLFWQLENPYS